MKEEIKQYSNRQLIDVYRKNIQTQQELWDKAEASDSLDESESYLAQYLEVKNTAKNLENELSYRRITI